MQVGGEHYGVGYRGPDWQGQPYTMVDTGAATHAAWSYAFSHEIVEMLVDPTDADYHTWPDGLRPFSRSVIRSSNTRTRSTA